MKLRDVAAKYKINEYDFEMFIKSENLPHSTGMMSISINDWNVEEYVSRFRQYVEKMLKILFHRRRRLELKRKRNVFKKLKRLDFVKLQQVC